jgi:YcxB-like protein
MAEATDTVVLRCDLGWDHVREVMATSRLLILMRLCWLVAGILFAVFLAGSIVLLRFFVTMPADVAGHHGLLLSELIAGVSLCACALLLCWSVIRVWRLSPGRQADHALASGVWQHGIYTCKLKPDGVAWWAPDGSATFLPWSALTGVCETERLFLLLDQEDRHVRGFIPKTGLSDARPATELGSLIRERIGSATS